MLTHLDDLESDMSVFHRVDDIESLSGPKFLRLAYRITCYQGVMAAQLAKHLTVVGTPAPEQEETQPVPPGDGQDLVRQVHQVLSNRR